VHLSPYPVSGVSIDLDTGLSVAVAPPDLPPVELGDAEDAAAQLAAAAGVEATEESGVVAGLPGLPPLLHNPAQGFNLPELIIPAKWLARFVSGLLLLLCHFLWGINLKLTKPPYSNTHRRNSNASTPPTDTATSPKSTTRTNNSAPGSASKNSNTNS
jgi:hypothetical protein